MNDDFRAYITVSRAVRQLYHVICDVTAGASSSLMDSALVVDIRRRDCNSLKLVHNVAAAAAAAATCNTARCDDSCDDCLEGGMPTTQG